jgi:hypothetical protein
MGARLVLRRILSSDKHLFEMLGDLTIRDLCPISSDLADD